VLFRSLEEEEEEEALGTEGKEGVWNGREWEKG